MVVNLVCTGLRPMLLLEPLRGVWFIQSIGFEFYMALYVWTGFTEFLTKILKIDTPCYIDRTLKQKTCLRSCGAVDGGCFGLHRTAPYAIACASSRRMVCQSI